MNIKIAETCLIWCPQADEQADCDGQSLAVSGVRAMVLAQGDFHGVNGTGVIPGNHVNVTITS